MDWQLSSVGISFKKSFYLGKVMLKVPVQDFAVWYIVPTSAFCSALKVYCFKGFFPEKVKKKSVCKHIQSLLQM